MEAKLFYSPAYIAAGVSFDTTRKSAWIVDSLQKEPISGVRLVSPTPLTAEQIAEVHDPRYVNAVQTGEPSGLAASSGFMWDPGVWQAVCSSNGGAVAAALSAMKKRASGSLSSGLHHAKKSRGDGFCTFNGLALAAFAAIKAGASSVLILDLDAHCGGGTRSLLQEEQKVRQLDISTNHGDGYAPSERFTLDVITRAEDYLPTLSRRLEEVEALSFDLCLYNSGMDAYEGCNMGGLKGLSFDHIAKREETVFSWCRQKKLPVAFVLAGGYTGPRLSQEELVSLHRLTIQQAALSV